MGQLKSTVLEDVFLTRSDNMPISSCFIKNLKVTEAFQIPIICLFLVCIKRFKNYTKMIFKSEIAAKDQQKCFSNKKCKLSGKYNPVYSKARRCKLYMYSANCLIVMMFT